MDGANLWVSLKYENEFEFNFENEFKIEDLDDLDWSMQALDVEFVDNDLVRDRNRDLITLSSPIDLWSLQPITYWTAAKDRAKTSSSEKMEECDIDEAPRYIWYLNETTNNIHHVVSTIRSLSQIPPQIIVVCKFMRFDHSVIRL